MSARTRRVPWWVLGIAFVVVPLLEIWTIVSVGQVVGPWWTIALLLADGVVGSWLVKREGGRAWRAFGEALQSGRMPHREIADGVLILVGGTLMITPGFLSDVLGVVMILPFTRPLGRALLARAIGRRLAATYASGSFPGAATAGSRRPPRQGDVVQGEVVDPG